MKTSDSRFSKCLYFSSNALARKVEKLAMDCWKPVNLSPSHAYLLLAVLDDPGVQPGAVADNLQLKPSTVTRLIEKLEMKELVVRINQGKVTNIYATPKGKNLLPALVQCQQQFQVLCCNIMGNDENSRLVEEMGKLADKIDET